MTQENKDNNHPEPDWFERRDLEKETMKPKDKEWIAQELEQNDIDTTPHIISSTDFTTWEIDFDKVTTVEDINTILKAVTFRFNNSHPGFDEFVHLLKKSENQ